ARDERFSQRFAIDVNPAGMDAHPLPRQSNHSFDIALGGIQGIMKHHDIKSVDRFESINKLVDEDPFVVIKLRHHAGAFHLHGLVEEHNHNKSHEQRKNQIAQPVAAVKEAPSIFRRVLLLCHRSATSQTLCVHQSPLILYHAPPSKRYNLKSPPFGLLPLGRIG